MWMGGWFDEGVVSFDKYITYAHALKVLYTFVYYVNCKQEPFLNMWCYSELKVCSNFGKSAIYQERSSLLILLVESVQV